MELGDLLFLGGPRCISSEVLHQPHGANLSYGRSKFRAIELETGLIEHKVGDAASLPNVGREVDVLAVFAIDA